MRERYFVSMAPDLIMRELEQLPLSKSVCFPPPAAGRLRCSQLCSYDRSHNQTTIQTDTSSKEVEGSITSANGERNKCLTVSVHIQMHDSKWPDA